MGAGDAAAEGRGALVPPFLAEPFRPIASLEGVGVGLGCGGALGVALWGWR